MIAHQILSGCKKDIDILTDKKDLPITAGEVLSKEDFQYHVFAPMLVVEPVEKCYTSHGMVTCGMDNGVYRADLDNNGKNDIAFSSAVYGTLMFVESRIHLSKSYSICPVPIKKGAVISSNLEWVSHVAWGTALQEKSFHIGPEYLAPKSKTTYGRIRLIWLLERLKGQIPHLAGSN